MLTDEAKIKVTAGKGGDGVVAFDKVKMSLGPTGGRGGNGGNVYFQSVSNLTALNKYKGKSKYWAQDGQNGRGDRSDGAEGKELVLIVPVGTVAHNLDTGLDIELTNIDQKILVARGGIGGRGNFYFRSSINTTPKKKELGKPGQEYNFLLELRLIADIGLIGLPNAGKSSLLNELTKADVKTADYPFTTLEPNLGTLDKIIIADIPGLISGASSGKGLGTKFLRHIRRTKILFHCISLESKNLRKDWQIIRKELASYDQELSQKREIILLTKSDLLKPVKIKNKIAEIRKINEDVMAVSIHDWDSLENLKKKIVKISS